MKLSLNRIVAYGLLVFEYFVIVYNEKIKLKSTFLLLLLDFLRKNEKISAIYRVNKDY